MKKLNSYRKVQTVSIQWDEFAERTHRSGSSETPPSSRPHSATPGRYCSWGSDPVGAFSSPFARLVVVAHLTMGPRLWPLPAPPCMLHPEVTLAVLSAAGGAGGGSGGCRDPGL